MTTESGYNDPRVGSAGLVGRAQLAGGALGYAVPSGLAGTVNPTQIEGECSPEMTYGLESPSQESGGV